MRTCPKCKEQTLPKVKLLVNALTSIGVIHCANCHCIVDFQLGNPKGIGAFLEWVLPELLILLFIIASFIYLGNIWFGILAFFITRLAKSYYIFRGPLIEVHS